MSTPPAQPTTGAAALPAAREPLFFQVGLKKLVLMYLVTFGLYEVAWFYFNWKHIQTRRERRISAPLRSVFFPFTSYGVFRAIGEQAKTNNIATSVKAGPLALGVLLLTPLWNLPMRYWYLALIGVLPLVFAQRAVRQINATIAPISDPNTRFSKLNILGITVGGAALVAGIVAALLFDK